MNLTLMEENDEIMTMQTITPNKESDRNEMHEYY